MTLADLFHVTLDALQVRSDHEGIDLIDIVLYSSFGTRVDGDVQVSLLGSFSDVGSHESGRCTRTTDK